MTEKIHWLSAVRMVAADDTVETATHVLSLVRDDVLRDVMVHYLLSCARKLQRDGVLREERRAAIVRRKHRAAIDVELMSKTKTELGLPVNAEPGDVIVAAIGQYSAALKMEWTAELLASSFTLSDGARVTWGNATVQQHRDRLQMFKDKAEANLEGAARHQAAIDVLQATHIDRLNDLSRKAA